MADAAILVVASLSVITSAIALILSVYLFRRTYGWRMLFLTILLLVISAEEVDRLAAVIGIWRAEPPGPDLGASLWHLLVTIVALAFVCSLARLLGRLDIMRKQVAESEERYRGLCRDAPVGLFLNDEHGACIYINPRCCELTGLQGTTAERNEWESAIHPQDRHDVATACDTSVAEKTFFSDEYRFLHPDGKIVWAHVKKAPIHDDAGEVIGFVGTVRDITAARRATQRLEESERRFRTLVENAPEAIVVLDCDTNLIVDCNENAEHLFKMSREQLLKNNHVTLSPPSQPSGRASAMLAEKVVADALNGKTPIFEWVHRDAEGQEIETEVRLVLLPHAGRRLIRGSVTDIRERKRAQEQVATLRAQMAHVARLSTMGEMVAEISHEINQPLYAISNFAQAAANVLKRREPDPELSEWIEEIRSSARLAGEIIKRMKDFTKPQETRQRVFNIHDTIASTIELLQFEIRYSGVVIEENFSAPHVEVFADEVQIQQALVNLLLNACDACQARPRGERRVQIATRNSGGKICVDVSDNGCGISVDPPSKIFETFFTTKSEGMGLGLAISRTLVSAHGGELSVRSTSQQGATLLMALPINKGSSR